MCANSQSDCLNTIYFTYFEAIFLGENQEKMGDGLSPPGKNQIRNQFVFLSFGIDPLNWQSFIEIGEMACSTTARCSRGQTLPSGVSAYLDLWDKSKFYATHVWCIRGCNLTTNSMSHHC